ncbi:hypothetical protein [Streptomyces glaucus]
MGLPVLARALWSSARLARANRNGTAGRDVTAYGLLPREELDGTEHGPTALECADATLAARQGDWRPSAALLAATGQDRDRRWRRPAALARGAVEAVDHYKLNVVTDDGACT